MADPTLVSITKGSWVKVADAVASITVWITKQTAIYSWTYRDAGGVAPTLATEKIKLSWPGMSFDPTGAVDLYIWCDGEDGSVRLDEGLQAGDLQNVTVVNAATYDVEPSDYILHVTYTATGAVTSITLPTAQVVSGRVLQVKDAGLNASTNNITIDTEGAETIDGQPTYVISTDGEAVSLYCDGSNWFAF
jgi:hypothetical protein